MDSRWSQKELKQLFDQYNKKFWNGELPEVSISIASLMPDRLGDCGLDTEDPEFASKPIRRRIRIDVEREGIQSTLLHEMAHVVTLFEWRKHGRDFCEQIEKLFLQDAPLDFSQIRYVRSPTWKSPELRKALEPRIISEFERQGRQTWQCALWDISVLCKLTHWDDKPKNRWAEEIISKGRKVHQRSRRAFLKRNRN